MSATQLHITFFIQSLRRIIVDTGRCAMLLRIGYKSKRQVPLWQSTISGSLAFIQWSIMCPYTHKYESTSSHTAGSQTGQAIRKCLASWRLPKTCYYWDPHALNWCFGFIELFYMRKYVMEWTSYMLKYSSFSKKKYNLQEDSHSLRKQQAQSRTLSKYREHESSIISLC